MAERLWRSLDEMFAGPGGFAKLSQAAAERMLSDLIYRPWFDRAASTLLTDWYFPLSRAWAAGIEAEGDLDRFMASTGLSRPAPLLRPALSRLHQDRMAQAMAESDWQAAFFGGGDTGGRDLADVEQQRRRTATRLTFARSYFLPLHIGGEIAKVNWQIAAPDHVDAAHGTRLATPVGAYALPDVLPQVEHSRGFETSGRRLSWLRFASPLPKMGTAWARLLEPADGAARGTLIFLHGIGVEQEFWPEARDTFRVLVDEGFRLILPEAPWHGRRRLDGFYGGEPILARGPLGVLDFMQAAVIEAGCWLNWARTLHGPVILGGNSLGALTSQLAAAASAFWPQKACPDAVLLVAPGGDFLRITFESALATGLGLPAQMQAAGWSREILDRWRPLADASQRPALPPERVIAALGSTDTVTHFDDARRMLHDWQVPDANIVVAEKGHFSVSLDAVGLRAAVARLKAVLD